MGIFDKKLQFADSQAITVTAASTNVVDLGVDRDVGIGTPIEIDMRVMEAFTADGAGTLVIALQTSVDEAFTSPIVLQQTAAIPKASLVVGYEPARWRIPSPTKRYLRFYYTVATGPMTAGKLSINTVVDRQANRSYPSGIPAQV